MALSPINTDEVKKEQQHPPLARRTTITFKNGSSGSSTTIAMKGSDADAAIYVPQLPSFGRIPDLIIGQTAAATLASAAVSPIMTVIDLSM